MKYNKLLYSIICSLLIVISISVAHVHSAKNITPPQLYEVVRLLLQQSYLDKTFNNQDFKIWAYENRYKGLLEDFDDADIAIKTMVATLGDRYTRYLDKKEYKEEIQAINAKLQGVGIQIGFNKDRKVVVIAPIQDSPAFKAGFLPKDEIISVDDKPTKGLSIEEVANMIRGEPHTPVTLTILRNDAEKSITVHRDNIKIEAIPEHHYGILNPEITEDDVEDNKKENNKGICYIHLTSFISQDATKELVEKLNILNEQHEKKECPSFILDLRNNPGGLLTNALYMSNIFLSEDMDIVSTVDRDGYIETQSTKVKKAPIRYSNKPMAILVNSGSASASEILSGALKDNGRAILVGDTTFGKGLVQVVRTLPNGSGINITAAKYLTPNGSDIHEVGIEPHYKVKLTAKDFEKKLGPWFIDYDNIIEQKINTTKDLQLAKAIEVLRKSETIE